MKTIEFLATYADGSDEYIRVRARSINSGFTKALKRTREPLGNGHRRELHSIQFSQVTRFYS